MREAALRVVARTDGKHEVQTAGGDVLAVCDSNAQHGAGSTATQPRVRKRTTGNF